MSTADLTNKAIDQAALAASAIHDLGQLFEAIRKLTNEPQIASLANSGAYLAGDWHGMLENSLAELETIQ